ncbi:MAG TPA: hypothetical protein VJ302_28090 [Blastocatellia bacterium]|nr:hypothetical protein [Blastocatellia bacterium]
MAVKIENQSSIKLPKKTEEIIQSVLESVPREHTRGLTRIVLVDRVIPEARVAIPNASDLPGLYHPRYGNTQPWLEIALGVLLPRTGFFKRLAARLNFKPNLAYLLLSLQAQHYCLTLSHGIKKHQFESAIRSYVEQYHKVWREKQSGWRGRLFKPIQPYIDKWARSLRRRYETEQKRRSA